MTEQDFDKRHGGAWDRGNADSYYRRPYSPHKYVAGTMTSDKVVSLSAADLEAYKAGWQDNEALGWHKEW
jgi:hypothetical protein